MQTLDKQTATIAADHICKFNPRHRKENACYLEVRQIVTIDQDEQTAQHRLHVPVELRLYGTGRTNSACLWINHHGAHGTAYRASSGRAGGYGYHRTSAAAQEAIENAGITLAKRIDGVGDNAIDEALVAIAEALGITGYALNRTHA